VTLPLLSRERTVAPPGFNRWLIPPCALAVHLCIGQAYAFSVFNLPLSRTLGVTRALPDDWRLTQLGWIFTLAIVFLGLSAAFGGRWLERAGPRRSGVLSALCFSAGFFVSALGVRFHRIELLYLGYGVVGGTGLGIGYITPVSTLIKWFPDRRGLATGLAIMGFGGGALVASPLSQVMMRRFASPGSTGVAATFVALGCGYLVFMLAGAFGFRLPPAGWRPAGFAGQTTAAEAQRDRGQVHVDRAIRTPHFYLLWAVLLLNVTAGIGVLGQASPMIQEVFRGRVSAAAAAGFVGLLSVFNMAGRIAWSSLSDRVGRKATYAVFFVLGPVLYVLLPWAGRRESLALFVASAALIMTLYGGGFATIPAYLADVFGTQFVGAIHGRLLTAWSVAGVLGPVVVNYMREAQLARGVAQARVYDVSMYVMAGLLVVGLVCNLAVRAVDPRYRMSEAELLAEQRARHDAGAADSAVTTGAPDAAQARGGWLLVCAAWTAVSAPLAWGVYQTLTKVASLLR
jgi:MFS family permease